MPPKRRKVPVLLVHPQSGQGIFGDIWRGVKTVGNGVYKFAKKVPIVSTGLALTGNPAAAAGARMIGLGKRRKQRGAGKRRKVVRF